MFTYVIPNYFYPKIHTNTDFTIADKSPFFPSQSTIHSLFSYMHRTLKENTTVLKQQKRYAQLPPILKFMIFLFTLSSGIVFYKINQKEQISWNLFCLVFLVVFLSISPPPPLWQTTTTTTTTTTSDDYRYKSIFLQIVILHFVSFSQCYCNRGRFQVENC